MNIRYRVDLSQDEHSELTSMLSSGNHGSHKLTRARTGAMSSPGRRGRVTCADRDLRQIQHRN